MQILELVRYALGRGAAPRPSPRYDRPRVGRQTTGKAGLLAWLLIAGTGVAIGCGSEQEDAPISVLNRSAKAVSFEEYRDRAVRVIDGKRVYNVEWDLFFSTEDDLRAHLMSRIDRETKK